VHADDGKDSKGTRERRDSLRLSTRNLMRGLFRKRNATLRERRSRWTEVTTSRRRPRDSRIGALEEIDAPSSETARQLTRHLARQMIEWRSTPYEKSSVLFLMIQLHGDDLERG